MTVQELQKLFLPKLAPEDFFILLAEATRKEKTFLLAHPEYELDAAPAALAEEFFARRLKHEPVASIVGHKAFYGCDFLVTPDTLIPRPETELIVEHILESIPAKQERPLDILDIGTGSGCIAISLAATLAERQPGSLAAIRFFATDISEAALAIARKNAERHSVGDTITFLAGDLLAPYLSSLEKNRAIIIAANLPYLSRDIYDNAPQDVRGFEPESALVSGEQGLDHYYRLLRNVRDVLHPAHTVTLFLEISPEQDAELERYAMSLFPDALLTIHADLAGKKRLAEIRLRA